MTSANLLIVIIVGAVVGALTGLALNGLLEDLYLAVAAGFLGTIIAGIARNTIMVRLGMGSDESRVPVLVLVYSAVASLAGSAAADEIVRAGQMASSAVWLGTLAGLFSAILMAMLMITYHMNPAQGFG